MDTKENKRPAHRVKKTATASALALLTAASVVTGSLFNSPAALLPDDGGAGIIYNVSSDGGADDDAGAQEGENGESRRRSGACAVLRERILRLPLLVRLLVILPLWALGSAILAAAGALWTVFSPVVGRTAFFALVLALLLGAAAMAAKAVFPDLPLKKLLSRRGLAALVLGAAGLSAADAVLGAAWADYARAKEIVVPILFFLALCGVSLPLLLGEQKRRLARAEDAEDGKTDDKTLTFTDGIGTFQLRVPHTNG